MRLRNLVLASAVVLGISTFAHAQSFSLTEATNNFITNFDTNSNVSLASTGSSIAISTFLSSSATTYNTGNGSSNAGGVYSFGVVGSTERALGSVGSGSYTGYFGLLFTNDGTSAINSIDISYTGEEWRRGGGVTATQSLLFSYAISPVSISSGTYTGVSGLDYNVLDTGASSAAGTAGPLSSSGISSTITFATPVAAGSSVLIRWQDLNDAGNDHGLAVDDLSLTANYQPVPAPPAAISLGIGGLVGLMGTGVRTLRARKQAKRKEAAK